jgi:carbonic anhydrase
MSSIKPSLVRLEGRKSNPRDGREAKWVNRNISLEDSIKEDLNILHTSTWIKKNTRLIGLKYDTHTGILYEVEDLKPQT